MGDLASYRLSDFILFSGAAYYRQFELYNQAIWPLHLIAILFVILIFYSLWKKPVSAGRLVSVLLLISWVWVSVFFLYQRFYQIHVIANWYAFGFMLQAGLIGWYGFIKNQFDYFLTSQIRIYMGSAVLVIAFLIYPFIAMITGRSWLQFEMFALAPDPTVLATIAILIMYKAPKVLYVLPILWLFITTITLSVM